VNRLSSILLALLAFICVTLPTTATACATCFGKSDSRLAHGMNMGILSLLIVVVFVLGAFAAFFVYLARRAASSPPTVGSSETPQTIK